MYCANDGIVRRSLFQQFGDFQSGFSGHTMRGGVRMMGRAASNSHDMFQRTQCLFCFLRQPRNLLSCFLTFTLQFRSEGIYILSIFSLRVFEFTLRAWPRRITVAMLAFRVLAHRSWSFVDSSSSTSRSNSSHSSHSHGPVLGLDPCGRPSATCSSIPLSAAPWIESPSPSAPS